MLVAVGKADLYADALDKAHAFYAPTAGSEFSARIKELAGQVGSDNFRWDALPVSSWPEDFVWNGQTLPSTLKTPERDHFLAGFAETIERYARG
jgi:hypothetical protein